MTWREDLRRIVDDGVHMVGASFRGVPFKVRRSQRSGGRRTVRHTFPFRDDPFVEDLGRKERGFTVEGYVLGDSYLAKRDALLAALEDESGPGELVHPYHGVKRAICEDVTVEESTENGGVAVFQISFCEAPAFTLAPVVTVDTVGKVASSATAARSTTRAELVERFTVSGMPAFALASASTALSNASSALGAVLGPITSTTQELASLNGQILLLTSQASALVRDPGGALDEFGAAIDIIADTIEGAPGAVFDALIEAYGAFLGVDASTTTSTRVIERENQLALTSALRQVLAIEAARIAPLVPFASIDDALAARDQIAGLLDEQAGLARDTAYPGLVSLRGEVLRAVPGSSVFARTITISRPVAVPSILLAYQLYGSVDSELDLVQRTGVAHPGFMSGTLKVLSNA
jgi:prophage DNA circulation protein